MPHDVAAASAAWALVWQIFQADKQRRWALLSQLGLTPVQGMVMGTLDETDPPTMGELGGRVMCDRSTLTGVIDRLEALDLVKRVPSPSDRRARCVALTSAGLELRKRLREVMAPPPPHLEHLTPAEAELLHALLAKAVERHAAQADG